MMESFPLLDEDERAWAIRGQSVREGQGTFRLRLLKAYGRCAITGEHTPIVLDGRTSSNISGPAATICRMACFSRRSSTLCLMPAT